MLKLISQVDVSTFQKPIPNAPQESANQAKRSTNEVFEGNIEDQARILCKDNMKREILDHVPEGKSDEDESADKSAACKDDEDKDMVDEVGENGHIKEGSLDKVAATQ